MDMQSGGDPRPRRRSQGQIRARRLATLRRRLGHLEALACPCRWDLAEASALRWALSELDTSAGAPDGRP